MIIMSARSVDKFTQLTVQACILLFIGLYRANASAEADVLKETRYLMGTLLEITLVSVPGSNSRDILEGAFKVVADQESMLSNYIGESELSRFNQRGRLESPSQAFLHFLSLSQSLVKSTRGKFNPGIRPLVELWDKSQVSGEPPSAAAILEAKKCLGAWPIIDGQGVLRSACPGFKLESGGIGKGYAVDLLVRYLRQSGVTSALIHFGRSSSFALGNGPDGKPWRLVIEFDEAMPLGEILIRDLALSASSSMGKTFTAGSRKYGHIINPASGMPLEAKIQAVVAAGSATEAEAWSKAALICDDSDCSDLDPAPLPWRLLEKEGEINVTSGPSCSRPGSCLEFTRIERAKPLESPSVPGPHLKEPRPCPERASSLP